MKRDMDLIRTLMLTIEGIEHGEGIKHPALKATVEDVDSLTLDGHLKLLRDAEFVYFGPTTAGLFYYLGITWDGHEFLDAARDQGVWQQAKDAMQSVGGQASTAIWIRVLGEIVLSNLGMK
jgi:hypothetical protein